MSYECPICNVIYPNKETHDNAVLISLKQIEVDFAEYGECPQSSNFRIGSKRHKKLLECCKKNQLR